MEKDYRYNVKWYLYIHLIVTSIIFLYLILAKNYSIGKLLVIIVYFIYATYKLYKEIISKEGFLKKEFRDFVIEIFILSISVCVFIGVGTYLYKEYKATSYTQIFGDYQFMIETYPEQNEIVLNRLEYNYDFERNKGFIQFVISEGKQLPPITNLRINIPQSLKFIANNTSFYEKEDNLSRKIELNKWEEGPNASRHTLEIINKGETLDGLKINISIEGNLTPNGLFRFYTLTKRGYANRDTAVIFNLGEIYSCEQFCVGEARNSKIKFENKKVFVSYTDDYYEGNGPKPLQQIFSLNTYKTSNLERKEEFFQYSIVVISIAMGLLAELFRQTIKLILSKY